MILRATYKIFKRIACLAGALLFAFALVACGGGKEGGDNGGENGNTATIKGYVRTVSFLPVSEKIYFDGKEAGQSKSDGVFEISVPPFSDDIYAEKLALEGNSFVTVRYGQNGAEFIVIKADEGLTPNDFYMLSGKVVKQFAEGDEVVGGETVASGTVLKIDGNPVLTFTDNRNFELGLVSKDSIISLENGDKQFITGSEIPFNNVTYAQILEITGMTPETTTIKLKGQSYEVSVLGGVTFRLKNDPNTAF